MISINNFQNKHICKYCPLCKYEFDLNNKNILHF